MRVVGEQHESRQPRRADGVTLCHSLGRVADSIERIGDRAHCIGQIGHLGDAAGVVGDRAVGVERNDNAGHRQHGRCRNRDSIQAR